MEIKESLERAIREQPILMFTKGNKMFPRCGFSKAVVDIMNSLEVPFETIDIFGHPGIKPALVEITDWPTTPQVFLGGEFVGGGDILQELHTTGELRRMVDKVLAAG
jgi:monothiol glutaredoxin